MAVHIADATIALILDLAQFEEGMSQVEARIAQVEQRAQQAGAAASQAASQAEAAAGSARTAAASAGGGGGGGGSGASWDDLYPQYAGLGTLPDSIRRAMSPDSPSGRGWSVGEDVGSVLRLAGVRFNDKTPVGQGVEAGATSLGDAMMKGTITGVESGKGALADAITKAVDEAFAAGKQAAEAESPSRRAAREIGGPIMEGIGVGLLSGTAAVTTAMVASLGFAFNNWKANTFGGTFVGSGLNVVANPGGMLGGGLGGFLGQIGANVQNSFAIGQPTDPSMASRVLMSNVPTGIRDWGQGLLSGAIGSVLPGWAAGPISDMLGTMFGLRSVISREAVTAPAMSADQGGFSDYPYGGGTIFNVNNNFNGNFTDVERQVQLGILQSARRLGVYI